MLAPVCIRAVAIAMLLAAGPTAGQVVSEPTPQTIEELKEALADLRRRLEQERRRAEEGSEAARLRASQQQVRRLTDALLAARRERDALRSELQGMRAERDRLAQAADGWERQVVALQSELDRARHEFVAAERDRLPPALVAVEPIAAEPAVAVLDGGAFAPGSADLRLDAGARLIEIAAWIRRSGARAVTVEGHTDASGPATANQELSLARATAVRDRLAALLGMAAPRLDVVGRGEDVPVASNATPEGRSANRRVEISLAR